MPERTHAGDPWPCCCDRPVGEAYRLARAPRPKLPRRRRPSARCRRSSQKEIGRRRGPKLGPDSARRLAREESRKEWLTRPLAVLLRSACWRSRPPSSSAAAKAAAPAPPQRSLPSIKSKRNRPAPRSKARAGFGPPLGSASRARMAHKDGNARPLAVLLRSACWRSRPPTSSAAAKAAAPAPPQRSLPSIKSKRNRPAPRSKARAGFGPPLGSASRARMAHKDGQRATPSAALARARKRTKRVNAARSPSLKCQSAHTPQTPALARARKRRKAG
jgi:hypothetical protein